MEKVMAVGTLSEEEVRESFAKWKKDREENNPSSVFAVLTKSEEFLGLVYFTKQDTPGVAGLGGIGFSNYWAKGYGTEAATAIIRGYAPAIIKEGYLLRGEPLHKITASAHPDNTGSWKIMERLGMHFEGEREKHGGIRKCYSLKV